MVATVSDFPAFQGFSDGTPLPQFTWSLPVRVGGTDGWLPRQLIPVLLRMNLEQSGHYRILATLDAVLADRATAGLDMPVEQTERVLEMLSNSKPEEACPSTWEGASSAYVPAPAPARAVNDLASISLDAWSSLRGFFEWLITFDTLPYLALAAPYEFDMRAMATLHHHAKQLALTRPGADAFSVYRDASMSPVTRPGMCALNCLC